MSKKLSIVVLCVAAAAMLVCPWNAASGSSQRSFLSPAGAWIATDASGATSLFNTAPADPSGSKFTFVVNDFQGSPTFYGAFPNVVARTQFIGTLARTGPRTVQGTGIAYATDADRAIVYIMTVNATLELTGPDTAQSTEASVAIYSPDQYPFGPEPPAYGCYPYAYSLERVQVAAPCEF